MLTPIKCFFTPFHHVLFYVSEQRRRKCGKGIVQIFQAKTQSTGVLLIRYTFLPTAISVKDK